MTNEEARPGPAPRSGKPRSGTGAGRPGGHRPREPITPEDRRRRPPGGERKSLTGFNDGVERIYCAAFRPLATEGFPVHARHDIAIRATVVVAERAGCVLVCNGGHPGPHVWPDGEPVASAGGAPDPTEGPDEDP